MMSDVASRGARACFSASFPAPSAPRGCGAGRGDGFRDPRALRRLRRVQPGDRGCVPSGLSAAEYVRIDAAFGNPRKIAAGGTLFRANDTFHNI